MMKGARKWAWVLLLTGAVMMSSVDTAITQPGYYDLGVFAFQSGDYAAAERHLKQALATTPDDAYVRYYLGKACLKQDRLEEADAYFQSARRLDPEIPGLAYDEGLLRQKQGDHARAAAAFESVPTGDPSHALARYHAGVSYFSMEQYEKALPFFDESAGLSPTIKPSADYYGGICRYQLSRYDEALARFDAAAQSASSESMRADARRWAADIRDRQSREKPYYFYARAGWLHDDNVGLAPMDSDDFSEEADQAATLFLSGQYALPVGANMDVGAGYSHYQTLYRDMDDYDLTGAIPEFFAKYRLSPFTFGLSYTPAYYWVSDESYLMQHQYRPEIRWRVTDTDEAAFSYWYSRNHYFQDDRRDGHANDVSLNWFHHVKAIDGFLYCGAGYEDTSATHPDEYFTKAAGRAGASWGFLKTLRLDVSGEYNDRSYDNVDSFYKKKREDGRFILTTFLSWRPGGGRIGLAAEYSHSRNESNINDYDYRRNTTAVYATAEF